MCGIAGELMFGGAPADRGRLLRMAGTIAHRGPDGEGVWTDGPVGFAHRRLAIVDLTPSGSQPMTSEDGKYAIVFNGEIYNYQELRKRLAGSGARFRSTSDTEVLLHLYVRHGEAMLADLRGMFAFAVWDADRQKLFFARDRIGKKPFFYEQDAQGFRFASELKTLIAGRTPDIDWRAVRTFLGLQYVPSPLTGFIGIRSLAPGECGSVERRSLTIRKYFAFTRTPKLDVSFEDAAHEVRRLTEDAVRLRLIADVPVGVFLSGGIDSAVVASLMARSSPRPIQTFTMGFPALGFDERAEAASLAKRLDADHHAFEAHPSGAVELVDALVHLYDAPYADPSALPTWLLAKETRAHVKAVETGDGGDELFGGYRRYQYFLRAVSLAKRGLAAPSEWLANAAGSLFRDPRYRRFARTVHATAHGLDKGYAALFTGSFFSKEDELDLLQPEFLEETRGAEGERYAAERFDASLGVEGALAFDLTSYLPDDLNVKMDRATMAHGLESRAPFLDQELAAYAARLPLPFLLKRGRQKPLMAEAFRDLVPPEVFTRPKRGFQVPLGEWFRAELRPAFVERCLTEGTPIREICRSEFMRRLLAQNDKGVDQGNRLWMLLVLSTWLENYV